MLKNKQEKEYITPTVEQLEARVEKGFAGSGGTTTQPEQIGSSGYEYNFD